VNPDEILVSSLAIIFSLLGFAVGVGPWEAPYQLRTFQRVTQRYGKTGARAVWILLSIAFLLVALAVLLGLRPSYATPSSENRRIDHFSTGFEPAFNIAG
jgi:uncharacterized protein HemY